MQEHIFCRHEDFSIPKYWSKSQDFALLFWFVEFPLMPWLYPRQMHQVGSGWRACDQSIFLLHQCQPERAWVPARWTRAQLGGVVGRGRGCSFLPCPICPSGEAVTRCGSLPCWSQDPQRPGSAGCARAVVAAAAAWLLLLPWDHVQGKKTVDSIKNPVMWETQVPSLGQEDPLEKGMATHSSILAWRILWTEEPGGLQSMGSQRVRHDWATNTLTSLFQSCYNQRAFVTPGNVWSSPPSADQWDREARGKWVGRGVFHIF